MIPWTKTQIQLMSDVLHRATRKAGNSLLFSHYLPTVLCNCGSSWAQKSESELCQQWTHKDYFTCILVHRICRMWMLLSDTMSYTSKNRQCMTKIWPSRNEDGMYTQYILTKPTVKFSIPAVLKFHKFLNSADKSQVKK